MTSRVVLDPRALSLFRILLALVVIVQSLQALATGLALYTDFGVMAMGELSLDEISRNSLSLHLASRWWVWIYALIVAQLCLSICLLIGFRLNYIVWPLAYLIFSLCQRNPYVADLADYWTVALVLVCGLLPSDQHWSVEGGSQEEKAWKVAVSYLLLLGLPASLAFSALFEFTDLGRGWALTSVAALFLLMQDREQNIARNLGACSLAASFVFEFGSSLLTLIAIVTSLSFVVTQQAPGEASFSGPRLVLKIAYVLLLLQFWPLGQSLGLWRESLDCKIWSQDRMSWSQNHKLLEIPRDSMLSDYRLKRYKNFLYQAQESQRFPRLIKYLAWRDKSMLPKTVSIKLNGRKFLTLIPQASKSVYDNLPALDRENENRI